MGFSITNKLIDHTNCKKALNEAKHVKYVTYFTKCVTHLLEKMVTILLYENTHNWISQKQKVELRIIHQKKRNHINKANPMKRTIFITIALITVVLTTNPVTAQDHQHHENHEQMMQMMEDSEMRAMMMEHIAENQDMRQEMMKQMRKSMMDDMQQMDHSERMDQMHQRMNNPEMKERMQKHMEMMQSMMEGDEMDRSMMMEKMQDSEMMKMHMMCMQMHGDDMNGGDTETGDHDDHH